MTQASPQNCNTFPTINIFNQNAIITRTLLLARINKQNQPETLPHTPQSSNSSVSAMHELAIHGLSFKGKATGA